LLYHAESSQKEKVAHDSKRSTFAIPRYLSLAKVDPKGQSLTSRIIQILGPVRAFWIIVESCLATGGQELDSSSGSIMQAPQRHVKKQSTWWRDHVKKQSTWWRDWFW
jgi:hypothetical protein